MNHCKLSCDKCRWRKVEDFNGRSFQLVTMQLRIVAHSFLFHCTLTLLCMQEGGLESYCKIRYVLLY